MTLCSPRPSRYLVYSDDTLYFISVDDAYTQSKQGKGKGDDNDKTAGDYFRENKANYGPSAFVDKFFKK